MSLSVRVDPLMVVSVEDVTVFVVEGIFTFPFVLRVLRVCVVPDVRKVEIEPVERSSSLP